MAEETLPLDESLLLPPWPGCAGHVKRFPPGALSPISGKSARALSPIFGKSARALSPIFGKSARALSKKVRGQDALRL